MWVKKVSRLAENGHVTFIRREGRRVEKIGKVEARQRRKRDLCCVLSASIPSSDPGEREQGEKKTGEMFLLQCFCLICNRPISLASIPAGHLTSGGTLLKLKRTGRGKGKKKKKPASYHTGSIPPRLSQSLWLSYMNRLQGHKFFKCAVPLIFVCGDLIFLRMKACQAACPRATWGYHMHCININKWKWSKEKQRKKMIV